MIILVIIIIIIAIIFQMQLLGVPVVHYQQGELAHSEVLYCHLYTGLFVISARNFKHW